MDEKILMIGGGAAVAAGVAYLLLRKPAAAAQGSGTAGIVDKQPSSPLPAPYSDLEKISIGKSFTPDKVMVPYEDVFVLGTGFAGVAPPGGHTLAEVAKMNAPIAKGGQGLSILAIEVPDITGVGASLVFDFAKDLDVPGKIAKWWRVFAAPGELPLIVSAAMGSTLQGAGADSPLKSVDESLKTSVLQQLVSHPLTGKVGQTMTMLSDDAFAMTSGKLDGVTYLDDLVRLNTTTPAAAAHYQNVPVEGESLMGASGISSSHAPVFIPAKDAVEGLFLLMTTNTSPPAFRLLPRTEVDKGEDAVGYGFRVFAAPDELKEMVSKVFAGPVLAVAPGGGMGTLGSGASLPAPNATTPISILGPISIPSLSSVLSAFGTSQTAPLATSTMASTLTSADGTTSKSPMALKLSKKSTFAAKKTAAARKK